MGVLEVVGTGWIRLGGGEEESSNRVRRRRVAKREEGSDTARDTRPVMRAESNK